MRQFIAFVKKEFYHIFRDRRTMLILLGMPVVQIILFGFAISTEVKNVRLAVIRLLRVFVSAPEEQRIARKMEQEHLTQPQAARLLRKMDKQRRKYYETYTHHVWGDSANYDLCIDTSTCTLDEAAARIADRFRAMA